MGCNCGNKGGRGTVAPAPGRGILVFRVVDSEGDAHGEFRRLGDARQIEEQLGGRAAGVKVIPIRV